jgi:hypothetical protein
VVQPLAWQQVRLWLGAMRAWALVRVLNRLIAPRPLYQVMDWLAGTISSDYLGVPARKLDGLP